MSPTIAAIQAARAAGTLKFESDAAAFSYEDGKGGTATAALADLLVDFDARLSSIVALLLGSGAFTKAEDGAVRYQKDVGEDTSAKEEFMGVVTE